MMPTNTRERFGPSSDKCDEPAESDDHSLLAAYVNGSEPAFTALVRRHIDLVYSAALRQVRNPHTAADVTSAVFLVLARKAGELAPGAIIAAWLHSTTRFAALKAIRARARRERYEQEAARMQEILRSEESLAVWEEIVPWLDESLCRLSRKDHEAIVLRFFQNKSFLEIATVFGSTEEAVRKRVNRAVEKLRQFLKHRGVVVSPEALAAVLENTVRPCPPGLSEAIRPVANSSGSTTVPPLILETLQTLRWRFWRPVVATAIVVLLASLVSALLFRKHISASLASPLSTFRLMTEAGNDGDGDRWSTFIHVTTPEEEQLRSLLTTNVVAQTELRRALVQRFGQADYERSAFPRLLDDTPESQIATVIQTVNGNEATLRFQRGSNFKFIRVRGGWKFDFFRTTSARPAQLRQSLESSIPRLRQAAQRVRAGEFSNSAAVATDFQSHR